MAAELSYYNILAHSRGSIFGVRSIHTLLAELEVVLSCIMDFYHRELWELPTTILLILNSVSPDLFLDKMRTIPKHIRVRQATRYS